MSGIPSIAVLCSGNGSNLQVLLDHAASGDLGARIAWVAGNNSRAYALERARRAGVPAFHVSTKTEGSEAGVAKRLIELVKEHHVETLVLAGYMRTVPNGLLAQLPNRVVNIHPSLLPAFGGQGMYGHHVHEAVIARGAQWSGVTVHLVTEDYDEGPILWQRPVAVQCGDTAEALAARVLKVEHDTLWRVIRALSEGRIHFEAGKARITGGWQ
jgi:phosphoribosylglycinamide formyltransferase-1